MTQLLSPGFEARLGQKIYQLGTREFQVPTYVFNRKYQGFEVYRWYLIYKSLIRFTDLVHQKFFLRIFFLSPIVYLSISSFTSLFSFWGSPYPELLVQVYLLNLNIVSLSTLLSPSSFRAYPMSLFFVLYYFLAQGTLNLSLALNYSTSSNKEGVLTFPNQFPVLYMRSCIHDISIVQVSINTINYFKFTLKSRHSGMERESLSKEYVLESSDSNISIRVIRAQDCYVQP